MLPSLPLNFPQVLLLGNIYSAVRSLTKKRVFAYKPFAIVEHIALHSASTSGGAQFYISCAQLKVTGGGSASPAGVSIPGVYKASDPGIMISA